MLVRGRVTAFWVVVRLALSRDLAVYSSALQYACTIDNTRGHTQSCDPLQTMSPVQSAETPPLPLFISIFLVVDRFQRSRVDLNISQL